MQFFYVVIFLVIVFLSACRQKMDVRIQPQTQVVSNPIKANSSAPNKSSLLQKFFDYEKSFGETSHEVLNRFGDPLFQKKEGWGENQDSLLVMVYPRMVFNIHMDQKGENEQLESMFITDTNRILPSDMRLGHVTMEQLYSLLNVPDMNYKGGMTITASGDTTITGNKTAYGDTVTFGYNVNIDEVQVQFDMIRDTVRRIRWVNNLN